MLNILLYSPLEQFEFITLGGSQPYTRVRDILFFLTESNTFFPPIVEHYVMNNDLAVIFENVFSYYLINIPVVIQGLPSFVTLFITQDQFLTDYFFSIKGMNVWNYFEEIVKNEKMIAEIKNSDTIFSQIIDIAKEPYSQMLEAVYEIMKDQCLEEQMLENFLDTPDIIPFWLNIYNSIAIVIFLFVFIFIFFNISNTKFNNIWVYFIDLFFGFLLQTFLALAHRNLLKYFPLFCTFFIFILLANLTALIPFSFCLTSNLWFTLTLSFSVWVGVTILAIIVRGREFFTAFVPKNVKGPLKIFITIIEIISYLARAVSLGVRIFANMLAGHSLVHILSDLVETCVVSFGTVGFRIFGIFPALILTFILFIEFGICFLQALVFVILFAIYLNEAFGYSNH